MRKVRKMNRKCFIIVFLSVFLLNFQVKAQPKVDIASGVERVLGTVMTKVEEVMKKVNSAAKSFEENLLGDAIKTNYETFMALKQSIQEQYEAGKEAYESAMATYNEGLKMYNDGKAYAEGAVGTIKGLHESTVKKLQELKASSPEVLEAKMADLKSQMDDKKEGMAEELEARMRVAGENVDVLEKMYNEANDEQTKEMLSVLKTDAEMIKAQYETDYEKLTKQEDDYVSNDADYQNMQTQYNEMASLLDQLKEAAKEKGLSLGTSFVQGLLKKTKAEKEGEYQALNDANFVQPDEPLNQAAVDRINEARGTQVANDVSSSYMHIIKERSGMQKTDEKTDQISDNVAEADYAVTAERLSNEQEIQKLKLLHRKIETNVAEMKTQTSNNMLKQGLRLVNPNKNPAEINMDNYKLDVKELQEMGLGK